MEEKNYEAIVEAILFTMGESVELEKIAAALELRLSFLFAWVLKSV